MIMMTAKVNIKKVLIALVAAAAVIIALISLLGGKNTDDVVTTMSDNDSRVHFLESQGWQVTTSPVESGQVRVPEKGNEVFDRYNELQKSQGYDLNAYAGKTVMRYVYEVQNYPDAEQPVYATLLVYKNQIIGGDVTNTAAKGAVQGLKKPGETAPSTQPQEADTAPAQTDATS